MSDKSSPPTNPPKRKWSFKSIFGRKKLGKLADQPAPDGLTKTRRRDGTCEWNLDPSMQRHNSFAATEDCFTEESLLSVIDDRGSASSFGDDSLMCDQDSANFSVQEGILVHRLVRLVDRGCQTRESSIQTEKAKKKADQDVSFISFLFLPFILPFRIMWLLVAGSLEAAAEAVLKCIANAIAESLKEVFKGIGLLINILILPVWIILFIPLAILTNVGFRSTDAVVRTPVSLAPLVNFVDFFAFFMKSLKKGPSVATKPKIHFKMPRLSSPRLAWRPPRAGRSCRCKCSIM